jgi:hypothetical protein
MAAFAIRVGVALAVPWRGGRPAAATHSPVARLDRACLIAGWVVEIGFDRGVGSSQPPRDLGDRQTLWRASAAARPRSRTRSAVVIPGDDNVHAGPLREPLNVSGVHAVMTRRLRRTCGCCRWSGCVQSQHGRPTKITLVPVALPVHLVDAYRLSVSLAGCVADGATTRRADVRWSGAAMIRSVQARIDGGLDHQVEVLALRRAAARSSSDSTGTGPMSARVRASAQARAARVRRSNCSASLILERGAFRVGDAFGACRRTVRQRAPTTRVGVHGVIGTSVWSPSACAPVSKSMLGSSRIPLGGLRQRLEVSVCVSEARVGVLTRLGAPRPGSLRP